MARKPAPFANLNEKYNTAKADLPPVAELLDLIDQGWSRDEIGLEYDCHHTTVSNRLMNAGYAHYKPGSRTDPDPDVEPVVVLPFVPPDWMEDALCAQTDPDAYYPEKGGSTREAKRICQSCIVQAECLDYALDRDERFGIWGGLSERERRNLKKTITARTRPTQESA